MFNIFPTTFNYSKSHVSISEIGQKEKCQTNGSKKWHNRMLLMRKGC